jgi:hypothetical protein
MVDLRVVDENMSDVPHDGESVGEIVARAPWLTTTPKPPKFSGAAATCTPATSRRSTRTAIFELPTV